MFDHKGIVTTEVKGNFETATEHAIQVDAEDVQEVEFGGVKEYHVSWAFLRIALKIDF